MKHQVLLTIATFVASFGLISSTETYEVSLTNEEVDSIKEFNGKNKEGPLKFAGMTNVNIKTKNGGSFVIDSEGATNLSFHAENCVIPKGCSLEIKSKGKKGAKKIVIDKCNKYGVLWAPTISTNRLEVSLGCKSEPEEEPQLNIREVYIGTLDVGNKSGSCNIDVVCPLGDGWRSEIRSVAGLSYGGSLFCTGAMINNMNQDRTPYFLTANHCGVRANDAPSLITYWNYETSECDGTPDGVLDNPSTGGAEFLSAIASSDATLLRLEEDPPASYQVAFAGWDNDPDAWMSLPGVAIHHPQGDEKRISFEYDPMSTTNYSGNSVTPDGTHVKITDWDEGTTEPGSSGSPLFNGDHRIIGQLHGGSAACGNNSPDWYGRFYQSYENAGFAEWLDPDNLLGGGYGGIDTFDPYAVPTVSPFPSSSPPPTESPTPCLATGIFALELFTDDYPGETSCTLTNTDIDEVAWSIGPSDLQDFTEYEFEQCLSGTCYLFEIFDDFGDGICCEYGQGYYTVVVDGIEIASGGNFDSKDSVEFCVGDSEFCVDSALPIKFDGVDYFCNDPAVVSGCDNGQTGNAIKSHCPVTCDACDEVGCADSIVDWRFKNRGVFSCNQISESPNRDQVCNRFPEISDTCPETCEVCQ